MRLLVADDDDANRLVTCALLEDEGFNVDPAASFSEAASLLSCDHAPYDVALLDENLGDGLGSDLARALRSHGARLRIVLLTGGPAPAAALAPVDACIIKGGDFRALIELVRALGSDT